MATTSMSGYSQQIYVYTPPKGSKSMRANGAEIYPGHCVTCTGQTWPDVALPDAISDSCFGIAGVPHGGDVDTVIADNDEFEVFLTGSGAIVYGFHKGGSGGSIVAGDILVADGTAANGLVIPLSDALQDITTADYTSTALATAITKLFAIVGRAMETHASAAANVPIQIRLSV
jgi:hypothetical protein